MDNHMPEMDDADVGFTKEAPYLARAREEAKQRMGKTYCLHPNYNQPPKHSLYCISVLRGTPEDIRLC